jgi:hypothetical protein
MSGVEDIRVEYAAVVRANAELQTAIDEMAVLNEELTDELQCTRDDIEDQVKERACLDGLEATLKAFKINHDSMFKDLKKTKLELTAAYRTIERMERTACKPENYRMRAAAARRLLAKTKEEIANRINATR